MIRVDSITIDTDDQGYELVLDTDEGVLRFNIHACAVDLYDTVRREIGPYVHEMELARATMPQMVYSRPVDVQDAIDAGYALDDPKSPGFHDRMVD